MVVLLVVVVEKIVIVEAASKGEKGENRSGKRGQGRGVEWSG